MRKYTLTQKAHPVYSPLPIKVGNGSGLWGGTYP